MTKEHAKEILDAACDVAKSVDEFNQRFSDAQIYLPYVQLGNEQAEEVANAMQLTRTYAPTGRNFVLINFTYKGVAFFG